VLRYFFLLRKFSGDYGMEMNLNKTFLYAQSNMAGLGLEQLLKRNPQLEIPAHLSDLLRADPEARITILPVRDLAIMQVPVGDSDAELQSIEKAMAAAEKERERAVEIAEAGYPQVAYYILKRCLGVPKVGHFLRSALIGATGAQQWEEQVVAHDKKLLATLLRILHSATPECVTPDIRTLISVSTNRGGLGVRFAKEHLTAARAASLNLTTDLVRDIVGRFPGFDPQEAGCRLAKYRALLDDHVKELNDAGVWVPDDPQHPDRRWHKQHLISDKIEEKMMATTLESLNFLKPDVMRYMIETRQTESLLDCKGFLDNFGNARFPEDYAFHYPPRLLAWPTAAKLYIGLPINLQNKLCSKCKDSTPLGLFGEHALCCKDGGMQLRAQAVIDFLKHMAHDGDLRALLEQGIDGNAQHQRPGDLALRMPDPEPELLVDHTFRVLHKPSLHWPAAGKKHGEIAIEAEKSKFTKLFDKNGLATRPMFPESSEWTAMMDHAKSRWDPPANRPLVRGNGRPQHFWGIASEYFGSHGPHFMVLLNYLATRAASKTQSSPKTAFSQARRNLSTIIHCAVGMAINRAMQSAEASACA
jgi:hypothetical protein